MSEGWASEDSESSDGGDWAGTGIGRVEAGGGAGASPETRGTASNAREAARQELSGAHTPREQSSVSPRPSDDGDLRYDPRGQWKLEGDELREHLANERRRELELKQKREKKKALYRQHVAAKLANPEADGRLHEYTERQALRRRAKQEHGDTHIAGPTQAVRVSVYADVGIGRGDRPGRDWYQQDSKVTGGAADYNKKSGGVVFGSGIPAAAIRGTAPRDIRGGGRMVQRADYAPTLPRVARIAVGDEQADGELGYNRHARKPAKKAAALAKAALDGRGGGQDDESPGGGGGGGSSSGGPAAAGARVQAMRSKGDNVRATGKDGGLDAGLSAVRDDVMRRIRALEKSTRQQEGVYSAAMGAVSPPFHPVQARAADIC